MAVKRNAVEVVDELIKTKFPLDAQKNNGITAVGIAAYRGNTAMLQRLVTGGADPFIVNKNGIGSIYMALKGN